MVVLIGAENIIIYSIKFFHLLRIMNLYLLNLAVSTFIYIYIYIHSSVLNLCAKTNAFYNRQSSSSSSIVRWTNVYIVSNRIKALLSKTRFAKFSLLLVSALNQRFIQGRGTVVATTTALLCPNHGRHEHDHTKHQDGHAGIQK
jgi:hypothetical protein